MRQTDLDFLKQAACEDARKNETASDDFLVESIAARARASLDARMRQARKIGMGIILPDHSPFAQDVYLAAYTVAALQLAINTQEEIEHALAKLKQGYPIRRLIGRPYASIGEGDDFETISNDCVADLVRLGFLIESSEAPQGWCSWTLKSA